MDNWNILLEMQDDGFTVATVLEVPNLQIIDKTKQGAISRSQHGYELRDIYPKK